MPTPLLIIDAFTDHAFAGNPAAVCLLDAPAPLPDLTGWMQRLAAEMNLSETAYPVRREDGGWDLRWFTPRKEVDLCGHATLASAHALWETNRAPQDAPITFHSKSGPLTATRDGDRVTLDFPARPPAETETPEPLLAALSEASFVGAAGGKLMAALPSESKVRGFTPDRGAILETGALGLIVTAPGDHDDLDLVSRFFAPAAGIDEDPVTGSAHCLLAPYWAERLGKTTLRARQLSARGGELHLELRGDRVAIAGRAVTTLRGELADAALPTIPQGATTRRAAARREESSSRV